MAIAVVGSIRCGLRVVTDIQCAAILHLYRLVVTCRAAECATEEELSEAVSPYRTVRDAAVAYQCALPYVGLTSVSVCHIRQVCSR